MTGTNCDGLVRGFRHPRIQGESGLNNRPVNRRGALLCLCAAVGLVALAGVAFPALAATKSTEQVLPRGAKVPPGVAVPNDTALAIYLPKSELDARVYSDALNLWVEPGTVLEESRTEVARKLFPNALPATAGGEGKYGLLLVVHPVWSSTGGVARLEMKYRVLDPAGQQLRVGSQAQSAVIAGNLGALRALTYKTMQFVLVDVLRELQPSPEKYPASGVMADIPATAFVSRDKPVGTGTGFFINGGGQMLTAAHVVRDCMLLEGQKDDVKFTVTARKVNDLLDLAVIDSGRTVANPLPFRAGGNIVLGESVSNVGFPLSGLLATSPNLTRGNVSARAGLKGSVGLFQFSAPIQPGSSGGPVVSDTGELLGITVSTLGVARLVEKGLLPQNVNFALDARHAAAFLKKEGVAFNEVPARTGGSMQQANDAALAAVVQLSCFQ